MLLSDAKMINLKVLMLQILEFEKRFWMSLGDKFIEKKGKAIKRLSVRILELRCFMFRMGQYFFASLPSARLC